jgi:hypothetical protein
LIVNLTPSERASGSYHVQNRNLSVLLPALKILSQVEYREAALDVALLDLTRRREIFHQEDVGTLNWPAIRDALTSADPGKIDVKSLADRRHNAAFFVDEVGRKLGGAGNTGCQGRAVVVLSSPVTFEEDEDLEPIHATPSPGCPVFYIRYRPPFQAQGVRPIPEGPRGRGGRGGGGMRFPNGQQPPMRAAAPPLVDQLEPTLRPLEPRLFDVETPDQFRKALAEILGELAAL